MNFSFFIAHRVAASGQKSFARLIIRIAIGAVALSIAIMIIAQALIKGFKSEISGKMFGFWGHIHVVSAQQTTTYEPIPMLSDPTFLETLRAYKKLPNGAVRQIMTDEGRMETIHGGVFHVQSYASKAGIIKTKDNFEGIILKGVGDDFDWTFLEKSLIAGKRLTTCETDPCNDILISYSTAERLKIAVGDKFIVHFVQNNTQQGRVFKVQGIYKTGLEEYDKKFALVDIRHVQQLLGWSDNQIGGYEVFLDDIRDIHLINSYIYNDLIINKLSAKTVNNQLTSQTVREEQPAIFEWLDLQDVNEKVILGLMLLVGIINMVTALLILILERTNMIGTLKSLGATNWTIQRIFLFYGGIIISIGLFIGNFIGIGLSFLEQKYKFIKLSEADYYLSYAPIEFDFTTILWLNVGTFVITAIFLLLPTLLILSISPVKAIRFK